MAKGMVEPISLGIVITYLTKSAPSWLDALRGTLFDKGKEQAVDKSISYGRSLLHFDEKEQVRHLELALKNAAERGLAKFQTLEERDQYRNILKILTEPGSHSETLRREALRLFTLSETPDLAEINEVYNRSLRIRSLAQSVPPPEIDAASYLSSFFDALIAELYVDPFFYQRMSDLLKVRSALSMQRSLTEVVATLHHIGEIIADTYTAEQFEQDLEAYKTHIERTLHYLKIVGVVPKDQGNKNVDPELDAIFVPLRIKFQNQLQRQDKVLDSITKSLECYPYLVLLGGPGSGKSTAIRHLAWSHASANLSSIPMTNGLLLPGHPLPLRIELRRLTEDRRLYPDYNFLSYATRVLLGREGVAINPQMFKELLERRTMLLLFDGLDEVATVDERKRLVEEIEYFALCYPGNRIIVTSRPVGYELTRFSDQWFSHAQVQEFNDEQIWQFLQRWYTHVLQLSPIPHDDQQELETLFKTLKDNTRLRKLAMNPLLLSVITALHRYERLPDRRVLIYDRCADLLLETWAKLKGTDVRWKDMKMVKEDQYACIAHIGFVLHKRSQMAQEKDKDVTQEDIANDVPTRFILKEIEQFLEGQNLFLGIAERRMEAKRFIELMQVEAGLIVERGTDENGELLYGFVHRTFQEYFAAADVYEHYQQEDEPTIISQFLKEHLHDPHWHEVILLLFGKLKRKPATVQLRLLLSDDGKSRRSKYTNLLQQDLFFACGCLAEDIGIDIELAEFIILHISDLVKNSPFPTQRLKALNSLSLVIQTRQYDGIGRRALMALLSQNDIHDIDIRIQAAQLLYQSSSFESEEKQQVFQILFNLAQQQNLSFKQTVQAAQFLHQNSAVGSEKRQQMALVLLNLIQRPNLSFEQIVQIAQFLYQNSPVDAVERRQASLELLNLVQRPNLSLVDDQALQAVKFLYQIYQSSLDGSEERQQATQILLNMAQQSNLSFEQAVNAQKVLYQEKGFTELLEERRSAAQILLVLALQPGLLFKQLFEEIIFFSKKANCYPLAVNMLVALLQRSDIPLEQLVQTAQYLYPIEQHAQNTQILYPFPSGSKKWQQASQVLFNLVQRPDLPFERIVQIAKFLYQNSPVESEERQQVTQVLFNLIQQHDVSFEQTVQVARFLYQNSNVESEERHHATQILLNLTQQSNITFEQTFLVLHILYRSDFSKSIRQQVIQLLLDMAQESKFSNEQPILAAQIFNRTTLSKLAENWQVIQLLLNVTQQSDLSLEQIAQINLLLYQISSPKSEERQQVTQALLNLSRHSDLSINHVVLIAQTLYMYQDNLDEPEEWQQAASVLLNLTQRVDLSFEQTLEFAQSLYQISPDESEEQKLAIQIFMNLAQQPNLSYEQVMQVALILYQSAPSGSNEWQCFNQILLNLAKRSALSFQQVLQASRTLYQFSSSSESAERKRAVQIALDTAQQPDLSSEQLVQVALILYQGGFKPEQEQATQILWKLVQSRELPFHSRLEIATIILTSKNANYLDRLHGVQMVNHLLQGEPAKQFLKEYWQPIDSKTNVLDTSSIVELVRQEVLSTEARDEMYKLLLNMVPEFERLEDSH